MFDKTWGSQWSLLSSLPLSLLLSRSPASPLLHSLPLLPPQTTLLWVIYQQQDMPSSSQPQTDKDMNAHTQIHTYRIFFKLDTMFPAQLSKVLKKVFCINFFIFQEVRVQTKVPVWFQMHVNKGSQRALSFSRAQVSYKQTKSLVCESWECLEFREA